MRKLVVIGLDGGTFSLLESYLEILPTFKNLYENGYKANLLSTLPPISPPAWASFMTGKNVGKHGVCGFLTSTGNPVSSSSIKDKVLWEILSEKGITVGVVNVPLTYPPRRVKGFLVSGFLTPPQAREITFPPSLISEISELKDYRIDVSFAQKWLFTRSALRRIDKQKLLREQFEITAQHVAVAKKLLQIYDPLFFIIVFRGTDTLQHYFWGQERILQSYYRKLDEAIEEILNCFKDTPNIFILSDHGFGPIASKIFYVNTWLKQEGFLKLKENIKDRIFRKFFQVTFILDILERIFKLSIPLSPKRVGQVRKKIKSQIDEIKSYAYAESVGGLFGIKILKEEIKDELIRKLLDLKDEKGQTIIKEVFEKEELYSGPFVKEMPDLLLLQDHKYMFSDFLAEKVFRPFKTDRSGDHANGFIEGIFIASGPDIKANHKIEEKFHIYDIAPTILHMFGLPIPDDMDGRVLTEIFREDSEPARRPVRYIKVSEERERIKGRIERLRRERRL